jgi:uncharacterized protein YndB with AHSA1/START domain
VTESALDRRARAVYDLAAGRALAGVDLPAPPERIFPLLAGPDVRRWWVNPGVFDTREWSAEVAVGGRWRAAGIGRGQPYALEGTFEAVDSPRRLVFSWRAVGGPAEDSTVTYLLDPLPGGTHLTVRHEGFRDPAACLRSCRGWETSLAALEALVAAST